MATGAPMATIIPIPMHTRAPTLNPILTLAQWLSPAYPVGAFTYSHGLEACVDQGLVSDGPDFEDWVRDVIAFGAGRTDVILLSAAHRCPRNDTQHRLQDIDALARALAPSSERLLETDQQGAAFSRTTTAILDLDLSALTYPVAVGRAAALQELPLADTARLFLHAFVSNLTSCATRLVPLGQTEAQTILHRVAPLCQSVADRAINEPLDAISGSTFAADIASMQHETQYSRLFRS